MTCPECNGCGEVVIPCTITADDGSIHIRQVAMVCPGCAGTKEVDG